MKFVCKHCNKSYSCGKALGGHLSSHKMATTDYDVPVPDCVIDRVEEGFGGRGFLGKKFMASGPTTEDHCRHLCKECGKGFISLKALCGHMACHSEKDKPGSSRQRYELSRSEDSRRRRSVGDGGKGCWEAAAEGSGQMQPCRRSKRVRCMNRAGKFDDGFSFISGMMTVEEVARCLMMMSNDPTTRVNGCSGRFGDYSGSLSVESDEKLLSSEEYSGSPRSSEEISFEHKQVYKKIDRLKMPTMERQRNGRGSSSNNNNNNSTRHECPICFRMFKSGQAMGGHKRSHFLGKEVTSSSRIDRGIVREAQPLIDLNSPAFLEGGEADREEGLPW